MKLKEIGKMKYLVFALCIALFSLAGYFFLSAPMQEDKEDTWTDSGFLKLGSHLTIQNTDNRLSLLDSKDILSANGLYYAAWTMGGSEPYENSDGETIDLYDAQLYLCLAEHKNKEDADKDMITWLDVAKSNYDILAKEDIICNDQSYCLITYNCVTEGNPYERGVSAFGVYGSDTICIELTCRKGYEEDLRTILTHFLDNCSYN